jgi:hypothetical protein
MPIPTFDQSPIASDDRAHTISPAATFTSLARIPLVPDKVLKRHGAYCAIAAWRDGPPNAPNAFGSILSPEAARAGKNFLTPAIHRRVIQELLMREDDAAIDEWRLFGNALSSMPMLFNLLAPLASDRDLATAVFRRLMPEFATASKRLSSNTVPADGTTAFCMIGPPSMPQFA